ncbi:unnamed protein product [Mytilus coruscus]|uniref:Uncharacterized protein n=1 Tax=Mytilus coruscus TaxID=42192 RepID=A0A6J8A379_MYTCO|nr:unnamed protein product [Mytilus coruscus]
MKQLIIVIDFAENYSCFSQNEIQGAHWAKDSVTIHPCVCTYMYNCQEHGKVQVEEIVDIISNDLIHDSHAVHTFTKKVMDHFQNERNLDLEHVVVISDGCAGQYKSKVPFMDASCFVEDFGVSIERCYYGSRHGKNRCDGEAGVVKSKATRLVKNDEAIITNASEFFDAVSEHLTKVNNDENCCLKRRVFIFVEFAEIVRPRIDKSAKLVKGTRQLHSILGATTKGNIQTRKLSCFCTQCIDRRYDRCVNGSHVDGWQSVMIKSVHVPVNRPEDDSDDTAVDEDNGHNGDPVVLDEDPVVLDDGHGHDEDPVVLDDGHGHDEDPVVLDDGHGVSLELGNISFDPDTSFSYIRDDSMIEDTA